MFDDIFIELLLCDSLEQRLALFYLFIFAVKDQRVNLLDLGKQIIYITSRLCRCSTNSATEHT